MKKILLGLLFVVFITTGAFAQQTGGTQVMQQASRADVCSVTSTTAAINNTVTLTLTPPNGQYVYLCGIDLNISNNATGAVVATNLVYTSTNLGGWQYKFSSANAANTNGLDKSWYWGFLVKSAQPGTAVTIVSPAANAQAAYTITGYYYFAP